MTDLPAVPLERYTRCPHCQEETVRCDDCEEGHLVYRPGDVAPCPSCGGRGLVCPDQSGIVWGESFNRGCEGWRERVARELIA